MYPPERTTIWHEWKLTQRSNAKWIDIKLNYNQRIDTARSQTIQLRYINHIMKTFKAARVHAKFLVTAALQRLLKLFSVVHKHIVIATQNRPVAKLLPNGLIISVIVNIQWRSYVFTHTRITNYSLYSNVQHFYTYKATYNAVAFLNWLGSDNHWGMPRNIY